MNLHALFSFYDEPPELLITAISSLPLAGVDHVVALDGAYAMYPDGKPVSHPNQHAAIVLTCRELGMACTLHAPSAVWAGNEPEKRTALFALGNALARPGDWFMVHDADMIVSEAPPDLKDRLADCVCEAAEVMILDRVAQRAKQPDWPERHEFRAFYRAQEIRVGPAHSMYRAGDGRLLWGQTRDGTAVHAADLTGCVLVEHHPDARDPERSRRKLVYYMERDRSMIERGACQECGQPAVALVPKEWRKTDLGPAAEWMEACQPCYVKFEKRSRYQLLMLGVTNPDEVTYENRMGHVPAAQ